MRTAKSMACILVMLLAVSAITACVQNQTASADPTPVPKTEAPVTTAEPTEVPTEAPTDEPTVVPTEAPTPAPTETPVPGPRPSVACPPVSELYEHDYNAVRTFLEIRDENGVRNGEHMNEYYDPDDPTTWFFWGSELHAAEGNIPIAEFNESGRLWRFYIPCEMEREQPSHYIFTPYTNITGKLDLSGCEELISVEFSWCGITSLDVTGCNKPHIDVEQCEQLEEVVPETLEAFHILISFNKLKKLHWVSVPEEHEEFTFEGEPWYLNNFDFDVTVVAEGDGYIGLSNAYVTDWDITHFHVELVANWDSERVRFIGWYDKDGKLVSSGALYLPEDPETGLIQGTFYYVARFERINGD